MSKKILIRNADAIVTCDQEDRVLYNSDILICGGWCFPANGAECWCRGQPQSESPSAGRLPSVGRPYAYQWPVYSSTGGQPSRYNHA